MAFLNPPGQIDDFDRRPDLRAAFAEGWDRWLRWQIKHAADAVEPQGGRFGPPIPQAGGPEPVPVPWDGFPAVLKKWFQNSPKPDDERWRVADIRRRPRIGFTSTGDDVFVERRQQDEYCEWFARPDGKGGIARIDFTCEAPEYWRFLAGGTDVLFRGTDQEGTFPFSGDLSLVLELYREHVDPGVAEDDLVWHEDVFRDRKHQVLAFAAGEYNPFNVWNTQRGAMHLTHRANTLGAEIQLAADGTVSRQRGGAPVTGTADLVCCSAFGEPNRSSDPTIGAAVNRVARQTKQELALADPIGLYIAELDRDAFSGPTPDWAVDPSMAWVVDRGTEQTKRVLRAHFQGSGDGSVRLAQIRTNGRPIKFGGQVADAIQMILFGEAHGPVRAVVEQECISFCCANPNGRPVRATPQDANGCAGIDWTSIEPLTIDSIQEGFGGSSELEDRRDSGDRDAVELDTTRGG